MRPTKSFLLAAAFAMSCFLTLASAQTVTLKGVVRDEFPVKEGKIIVYLPNDIRTGDVISGTVVAEPSGNNEKEKNRNMALLQKYQVSTGPVITRVSNQPQPIKFLMAEFKSTHIALSNDKIIEISNFPVPIINSPLQPPASITIPTHALTGSPLRITGPFDGDASNTKCRIDGREMEILAESPRQTIVNMPPTTSGPHTITIEENGKTTEQKVNAVNMDMGVDRTNLRTGQKAIITTTISGLQNLPDTAILSMSNASTGTVTLVGGNTQTITITPSQVSVAGTYTQTFTVQSLTTGNFIVNADLNLPDPENTTAITGNHYIVCPAANGLLLRQQECEKLTGLIKLSSKPGTSQDNTTTASIPPAQLQTTKQGNNYHFSVKPVGDAIITSVVWTLTLASNQNSLPKTDTLVKENTYDILLPDGRFTGTVNTIQANVSTSISPEATLFYTVIKNNGDQLYAVTSPIAELETERAQAQSKADQEWEKQDQAQKERDRLISEASQAEKNNIKTQEIATALENIDALLTQLAPMYQVPMKQLVDELAESKRNNAEAGVNWRERCAGWEEKMIDCHSQVGSLGEELIRLSNSIATMKPGKAMDAAKKRKKELEEMLKNLPAQCDEIVKQLDNCREQQKKATAAYNAQQDYEGQLWELCDKIMKMMGPLQDWCKAHRAICNVDEKLNELARNCPPKDPQQFQQYWSSVQQIISYKQTIEGPYTQNAKTTGAKIEEIKKEIKKQDSITTAERDSVWKYGTQADKLQKQINDERSRQTSEAAKAEKEQQDKLKGGCEKFIEQTLQQSGGGVSPSVLAALLSQIQSAGETISQGMEWTSELSRSEMLKSKIEKMMGHLDRIVGPLSKIAGAANLVSDLNDLKGNLQTLFENTDANNAVASANKFAAYLQILNTILGKISSSVPIVQLFTGYFGILVQAAVAIITGAQNLGSEQYKNIAESCLKNNACPALIQAYLNNNNSIDAVYAAAQKMCGGDIYKKTSTYNAFITAVNEAALKQMISCCLKWITEK